MVDGRHIGNRKFALPPQPFNRSRRKFAQTRRLWPRTMRTAKSENVHILRIPDGGLPPYWKSKNLLDVQPIATKFRTNTQTVAVNRVKN